MLMDLSQPVEDPESKNRFSKEERIQAEDC